MRPYRDFQHRAEPGQQEDQEGDREQMRHGFFPHMSALNVQGRN
jgi:hypothetical protein